MTGVNRIPTAWDNNWKSTHPVQQPLFQNSNISTWRPGVFKGSFCFNKQVSAEAVVNAEVTLVEDEETSDDSGIMYDDSLSGFDMCGGGGIRVKDGWGDATHTHWQNW